MATASAEKEETPVDSGSPTSPVTPQGQPQPLPSPRGKNCRKNLCPCCELRRGVLCIAICGIVFNTIGIITAGLIYGLTDINKKSFISIYMSTCFMGLISAIILAIGAAKKVRVMVICGFVGYLLGFVSHLIGGVFTIGYVAEEETDKTARTWIIVGLATWMIIFLTVHAYMTCVIFAYVKQFARIGDDSWPTIIGQRTQWSMPNTEYGQYHPPNPTPQESGTQSKAPNVVDSQSPMGPGQDHPKVPEGTGQKG